MTIALYDVAVPSFSRQLAALITCLQKGLSFAQAKKLTPEVLPNYRLAADMLPLSKQIQIASDNAKGACARLAGLEPPVYEDTEGTLEELIARLQKTLAFVTSFKPDQINGNEARDVVLKFPGITLEFKGQEYLINFALPNFYFHATAAYAILRHVGVEVGKVDYLGNIH